MQIVIKNPVKYLGVDYSAGSQAIADGLGADLIKLGVATLAVPLPVPVPVMSTTDLTGKIRFSSLAINASPDVVVYGANPGGVMAAITAAREGAKVALIEPSAWIGGMTTSGLSATDVYSGKCSAVVVTIAQEFYRRCQKIYGPGRWQLFWSYGLLLDPNVAEQVMRAMLIEAGVEVILGCDLVSVEKTGTRVTAAIFSGLGKIYAPAWVDGTYEGDLIAAAGCSVAIGREANATYGETNNGVAAIAGGSDQYNAGVDPYVTAGVPASGFLPGISYFGALTTGAASSQVQAICYRINITKDASIRVPFPEPTSYNALNYELLGRHAALAGTGWTTIADLFLMAQYSPTSILRYDANNKVPLAIDYVNPESTEYITASRERRNQIELNAKNHILGFLKFVQTDSRIPAAVRADVATYGLISDQWTQYGNFPPRPYIRTGRRLVGGFVMKDADILSLNSYTDPVAYSYYALDSHQVQCIYTGSAVVNEGKKTSTTAFGARIPFRVLLPKVAECTNVTATFAVSSSYAAHCALRMEPISMGLGGAAGITAAWAARTGKNVQDMDLAYLKMKHDIKGTYRSDGAVVAVQFTGEVNNGTTTAVGTWADAYPSANVFVNVGDKALTSAGVGATYSFAPNIKATGLNKVFIKWPEDNATTRSTLVPITITHAGGTTSFTVDQNNAIGDGGDWFYAGEYVFQKGSPSAHKVTIGTDGAGGSTIVNACKFMPSK